MIGSADWLVATLAGSQRRFDLDEPSAALCREVLGDRVVGLVELCSRRRAPFHSKVIAANASEAAHGLDTAGAIDHAFGLRHLLEFRFAPHIRDLADRRLYVLGARTA